MRCISVWMVVVLISVAALRADDSPSLRVGIGERPPFAMRDADGQWSGLAVTVWERIAAQIGLRYSYVEVPEDRLVEEAVAGRIDLAIGELIVSPERARVVDFSQPYLASPAAVAVSKTERTPHWLRFVAQVFAHGVGSILVGLLIALLVFSLLLWLVERRVDRTHFGGHPLHGFGSALWFAAVTMTTVGYGDKTPQSPAGRAVVLVWMFAGIVLISIFTGAVASSLAVAHIDSRILRTSDLGSMRTGVLKGSLMHGVLEDLGMHPNIYNSDDEGMKAVVAKQIGGFVDDEISLRFAANRDYPGTIIVDPLPTTHLAFAFAARPNFPDPVMRSINLALVEMTMQPGWEAIVEKWVGPPAR